MAHMKLCQAPKIKDLTIRKHEIDAIVTKLTANKISLADTDIGARIQELLTQL